MTQERTASELLIHCLEDFGNDEPEHALVIYTTKSGDIAWSSTSTHVSQRLGMVEMVRTLMKKKLTDP